MSECPCLSICCVSALVLLGSEGWRWAAIVYWGRSCLGAEAASPAVWAALQGAGTQLRDVRAKKDQLEAHIQAAQAMLAMDTGMRSLGLALAAGRP